MRPFVRILLALAGLVCLTLCLSQCGWMRKPEPKIRGLSAREADRLSDIYSPLDDPKLHTGPLQEMTPERREALANLLLQSRDYESSLVNYLQVLRHQPDRVDIRYKVGVIYLLGQQYEQAQKELQQVIQARPDMLEAHEAMGLVYLQTKQYPKAIDTFRQVLRQDGQRAQARFFLGTAYLASGKPREAITELEAAARLNPRDHGPQASLGEAYIQLKDYHKAIACLNKALALNPRHQKSQHFLGMALAGLKRYNEAFQAFLRAGDEAQAYNNIGVHYYQEGRYEEAAQCFQKALELRPVYYEEAKANLNRALEKMKEVPSKE